MYTDELSSHLVRSSYGCHYLGSVNHLYYADDMVLLSPTPFGLQKLLDVCADYALDHDMVFNTKKTVCMAILPVTSVTLLLLRSRCVVTHSPMLMSINILAIVLPTPIPELMILKFATIIEHYAVGPTHSVANSLYARTLLRGTCIIPIVQTSATCICGIRFTCRIYQNSRCASTTPRECSLVTIDFAAHPLCSYMSVLTTMMRRTANRCGTLYRAS